MISSASVPPASTFIVRFWWDRSGDVSRWRGQIQHVQSGESAAFLDIEGMLGFVRDIGIAVSNLEQAGTGEPLP
jgi:hypothetical protein